MTLQVDVAHSSIPRSTVSCTHYHKKYSQSYVGITTQLFTPLPQSKQNVHNQAKRKGSEAIQGTKFRPKTLQGNEATEEENRNLQETKKKAGLPLCSQTLPPPLTSASH